MVELHGDKRRILTEVYKLQNVVVQALTNMQRDIIIEGEKRDSDIEKDLQDIENIFQLAIAKIQFSKNNSINK